MEKGFIHIYTGDGRGKSTAAWGKAIQAAAVEKKVVIIQFLKGRGLEDSDFVRRLEPEIKLFRFEKSDENYEELSNEKKEEEIMNIRNGIGFARKVLSTGECGLIILDEVLGLIDKGILSVEEIESLLQLRGETSVIMTGIFLNDGVCMLADEVSKIESMKFKAWKS